ncbi:MAG: alpha/beta fold hydrolase, partial [Bacillota bacterium]
DIERIDIPVYLCMGKYDYQTPSIIAKEFCAKLRAPRKEFIWFEESAHSTMLEEPDKFLEVLLRVLDETS